MTRHEIATLALKILAMWLFAQAAAYGSDAILIVIFSIGGLFTERGFQGQYLLSTAISGVPAIGELIVGILFWRFASRFASRMVSDDPALVTRPDLTGESFLSIAFIAIGVWYLFPVLQSIDLLFIAQEGGYGFAGDWQSPQWQARFWSSLLRLAFSMWLILGSRGLAQLFLRLRRAGIVNEERTKAG